MRISIEGNIGCGKSTVLDGLRSHGMEVFKEPVAEWGPLLKLFYEDKQRWAFAFNCKVLLSFVHVPPHGKTGPVVVERSPYSCRHVFAQMQSNEGQMSSKEWALFRKMHEQVGWEPEVIIYIRTPPSHCMPRISERSSTRRARYRGRIRPVNYSSTTPT